MTAKVRNILDTSSYSFGFTVRLKCFSLQNTSVLTVRWLLTFRQDLPPTQFATLVFEAVCVSLVLTPFWHARYLNAVKSRNDITPFLRISYWNLSILMKKENVLQEKEANTVSVFLPLLSFFFFFCKDVRPCVAHFKLFSADDFV
jgi:hypothetical protein